MRNEHRVYYRYADKRATIPIHYIFDSTQVEMFHFMSEKITKIPQMSSNVAEVLSLRYIWNRTH